MHNHQSQRAQPFSVQQERLYIEDKRGDRQNLQYGQLDRYKISRYDLAGRGCIIGLDRNYRFLKLSHSEYEVSKVLFDASSRDHRDSLLSTPLVTDQQARKIKQIHFDGPEITYQHNYVQFPPLQGEAVKAKDSLERAEGQQSTLPDSEDGRSTGFFSESAQQHECESIDAFEQFRQNAAHHESLRLQDRVDRIPSDIGAWTQLVRLQEQLYLVGTGGQGQSLSSTQRRIVSEIQVRILETAISRVRDQPERDDLVVLLMEKGSQIWDTDRQFKQWLKYTSDTSSSILERKFLDWLQTSPDQFSVNVCVKQYLRAFQRARQTPDPRGRDRQCIYLVLRLTCFLNEAGYTERSIGIWQASLELNFFRIPGQGECEPLAAFSQFWNSEALRIGEKGATGWISSSAQPGARSDSVAQATSVEPHGSTPLETWKESEVSQSSSCLMPARMIDDVSDRDPYRIVLWSDIADFLYLTASDDGRNLLLHALVQYGGLPPLQGTPRELLPTWQTDPFLVQIELAMPADHDAEASASREKTCSSFVMDILTLFADCKDWWFPWSGKTSSSTSHKTGCADFVQTALMQLSTMNALEMAQTEYSIALCLWKSPSKARKYTKSLLNLHSSNLRLYNSYALLECRSNNPVAAERAWGAAISMDTPASNADHIMLWCSWIFECYKRGEVRKTRLLCCMMSDGTINPTLLHELAELTPTQSLRAESFIRSKLASALMDQDEGAIPLLAQTLAIFLSVTHAYSVSEIESIYASVIHQAKSTPLPPQSVLLESLHQSQARLLHIAARRSPVGFRPKQVMDILQVSNLTYPDNSLISSLSRLYLRRAGVLDRLRQPRLSPSDSDQILSTSKFSDVLDTLSRLSQTYGSTKHSTRSAFANICSPESPYRVGPLLWQCFIQFESVQAKADPVPQSTFITRFSSAKLVQTFHSAIRACPWSKDLYLLSFEKGPLAKMLGEAQLIGLYERMVEKGIRVRLSMSDQINQTRPQS